MRKRSWMVIILHEYYSIATCHEVLNIQLEHDCAYKTSNLHSFDLRWNAYRNLPGSSTITALCLSRLDLHLWALINKTKKWKFSKKIFTNTPGFAKFMNIFFCEQFLLNGMPFRIRPILGGRMHDVKHTAKI